MALLGVLPLHTASLFIDNPIGRRNPFDSKNSCYGCRRNGSYLVDRRASHIPELLSQLTMIRGHQAIVNRREKLPVCMGEEEGRHVLIHER